MLDKIKSALRNPFILTAVVILGVRFSLKGTLGGFMQKGAATILGLGTPNDAA